jgi:hypothetical protein
MDFPQSGTTNQASGIPSEVPMTRPESEPRPLLSWVLSPLRASYNSAPRGCPKNKIVSRGNTVVAALLVHGRLHPRQDKTRETKRSLSMNGMNTADAALEALRGDVIDIVLGTERAVR